MTTFILIAGWIICGVLAYLINRKWTHRMLGKYTSIDRIWGIIIFLMGAIGLFSVLMQMSEDWDKPAKW